MFEVNGIELDRDESRKAKVLYDYEAENEEQMTVSTDQVTNLCSKMLALCNHTILCRTLLLHQFLEILITLWPKLMESLAKSLPTMCSFCE